MIVTGNLTKFQLRHWLFPIGAGDSQYTFYGDCRDMLRLQKQPIVTSKLLTYPYVPPFRFRKVQSPDYPSTLF